MQAGFLAESLFRVFDEDNSGALSFYEFAQVLFTTNMTKTMITNMTMTMITNMTKTIIITMTMTVTVKISMDPHVLWNCIMPWPIESNTKFA